MKSESIIMFRSTLNMFIYAKKKVYTSHYKTMTKPRPCTKTISETIAHPPHVCHLYACMAVQRNMTHSKGAAYMYHHVACMTLFKTTLSSTVTRSKTLTIIELHLSEGNQSVENSVKTHNLKLHWNGSNLPNLYRVLPRNI